MNQEVLVALAEELIRQWAILVGETWTAESDHTVETSEKAKISRIKNRFPACAKD
ncbi:MAG: hypothetical protein HYZ72_14035 [Deltaproteobacteria bacterium]|nr:hypothetical protein [Deltaproteobacteria bacterium]